MTGKVHIFGIRHHGPGSARSLVEALEALRPDAVLIEGPPDAQEVLEFAAREELEPPVALLVYVEGEPERAVFYPFAPYSPEWQAIKYGLAHRVPVRFMDLPQSHRLAAADAPADSVDPEASAQAEGEVQGPDEAVDLRFDPLNYLAEIAGYEDGERWWDHVVESRRDSGVEVFQAVREAMTALREHHERDDALEKRREAHMRSIIRGAQKDGFERVAVVCGAWHAPALQDLPPVAQDNALLKGLPKVKTKAAWVPWSYDRLAFRSGYGAGVESPEWYHLLWEQREQPVVHWMTRVARLLRAEDLDASSAHVIEGVRLAETLATLRGRALPGLSELMEAALAVVCSGAPAPLALIERKLVVGDRLGRVPEDVPMVPLQADLAAQQKRLRLPLSADEKDYDFDLRKPLDLERSQLLHRLGLLSIEWGRPMEQGGRKAGTFHEHWRLRWRPELAVEIIDAARWGSTVADATSNFAIDRAGKLEHIDALAELLQQVLLADLPVAVDALLRILDSRAALARDVVEMMGALPPLAGTRRYGSVRNIDSQMLDGILDGLVTRVCIGLPSACASLDDDAAKDLMQRIGAVDAAILLLEHEDNARAWRAALAKLAEQSGLHALLAGRVARLLHDAGAAANEETARRLHLALSAANAPLSAAHWIEGFLAGSGLVLIHDENLWALIDGWLAGLAAEHFMEALPLLRRTFSTFQLGERRQMGERARRGAAHALPAMAGINAGRAARVVPVLMQIFGEGAAA